MEADREPNRGVSLSVSNAVFSKLIKIGRERGQTPQRAAQALFEVGYEAECLGKKKALPAASAEAAIVADEKDRQARDLLLGDMINQLQDICTRHGCLGGTPRVPWIGETMDAWAARIADLEAELLLAAGLVADLRAQLSRSQEFGERQLQRRAAVGDRWNDCITRLHTALSERDQARQVIASKDTMLLDQARQIRELTATHAILQQQCEANRFTDAEMQPGPIAYVIDEERAGLHKLFEGPLVFPPKPAPIEQDKPEHEKIVQLKRLIRGRHACGLSHREIARELGLPTEAIRQALA